MMMSRMIFFVLIFLVVDGVKANISPIVKCTVRTGSVCAARWGYDNDGDLAFISPGNSNGFSQTTLFVPENGRVVKFEPGRHETIFQTIWNCALGPLQWTIDDGSGPRTATALHANTCSCGTGCLAGLDIEIDIEEHSIKYELEGGNCDVSHLVFNSMIGCDPFSIENGIGERSKGPCNPDYNYPYKIDIINNDDDDDDETKLKLNFTSPMTFVLDEITIKGGQSCSTCETYVPVCPPQSSTSSITTTTTTYTTSIGDSIEPSNVITSLIEVTTRITSSTSAYEGNDPTLTIEEPSISSSSTKSESQEDSSSSSESFAPITSTQYAPGPHNPNKPSFPRPPPLPKPFSIDGLNVNNGLDAIQNVVDDPKAEEGGGDPYNMDYTNAVGSAISTLGWTLIGILGGLMIIVIFCGTILILQFVLHQRQNKYE